MTVTATTHDWLGQRRAHWLWLGNDQRQSLPKNPCMTLLSFSFVYVKGHVYFNHFAIFGTYYLNGSSQKMFGFHYSKSHLDIFERSFATIKCHLKILYTLQMLVLSISPNTHSNVSFRLWTFKRHFRWQFKWFCSNISHSNTQTKLALYSLIPFSIISSTEVMFCYVIFYYIRCVVLFYITL